MNIEALSISFRQIEEKIILADYLQEVCSAIIDKSISRSKVESILKRRDLNYSLAKVDFLHLIFEYIKKALEDNLLTLTEKENIKFLKVLFKIQEGDFYLHNSSEIESTIAFQLSRIYLDDTINSQEALLKVDLQEIFDLSFDEMNDYAKVEAAISIQKGANPNNLDIFFTQKEFFRLR